MHTCIFSFASSSTRTLVRSLLIDNEPTHFVVSAHFHSNISHAKSVRAYAFRSGAHFHAYSSNHHLLQAVRGKTNKTTAFPREHEYTSFILSRIQHFFVNCLTLTIIRHHVRISIIRSIILAKIPHAHAKSHSAYEKSYMHVHFYSGHAIQPL